MKRPIYLDNHATTPLDPRVLDEMLIYFKEKFGNASSIDHIYGNETLQAINDSRQSIATLINSDTEEIIFTSGATESDNLALFGIADYLKEKGNHIITSVIEHKAILNSCKKLENNGYNITYLGVNKDGVIDINELKRTISSKTILISIMAANNEIGTISPLKEIGIIAHKNGILFHTDAAQAFGHVPINVRDMNIDLMSISGHKVYGPKGIGALYVKQGIKLTPMIYGGSQERSLRSGTLNVPGIVGLGAAAKLAKAEMKESISRLTNLRHKLYEGISSKIDVEINGPPINRLPHNLSLYIKDVDAKALINEVKDFIAISSGSACNSSDVKPSHVIVALGYDDNRAYSTIRFGLGRFTTEEDIDKAIDVVVDKVKKLKSL